MSDQISTAFVKQYHDMIDVLLQQRGSRFGSAVRVETQHSEFQFFEQMGSVEAAEITDRHADSPMLNTPHARRRVQLKGYDAGDMIDTFDRVQMLIDPSSEYVRNFVDALNRKRDNVIRDAFFADVATGKDGGSTVSFPTANVVNEDFGGANTALTLAKLIEARRLLESFENDPEAEPWYIAVDASSKADLLNTTEVKSVDYNSVKALVQGQIDTYLGFKFINFQRLNTAAGGGGAAVVKQIPVWTKSGMIHTIGKEITTEVSKRADKRFSWYAYVMAAFGAVRMQENKVIRIERFVS